MLWRDEVQNINFRPVLNMIRKMDICSPKPYNAQVRNRFKHHKFSIINIFIHEKI